MQQESAKKSLLIIKSRPESLGTVEGFLKNREWTVKSTANLKEALIFLVQQQPQFVMVSIDHPNRKVRHLPKILMQAFPVCVIPFAEEASSASYNLLNACASDYVLYPPVTGPAVERTVNKYYKDLQAKPASTTSLRAGVTAGKEGVIAIKGEGGGFSAQNAQSVLAQMFGDDGGPAGLITNSPENAAAEIALHAAKAAALQARLANASSGYGGWRPLTADDAPLKRRTPEEINSSPEATKKDSVILRGTQDALEKSCTCTSTEEATSIAHSSRVACIKVESTRFSGYLVTAMGKDKTLDEKFMAQIQERLFRFLKENGEDVKDHDAMDLRIREVPFEDWSLQQAEFLRKSIHDGHEVAIAFFPCTDMNTRFGTSAAEEMATIGLEDLAGDVAVEFNVYIYLPRNNRYVLYTPRGGVFYHVQKERLQSQGISQLHILKGDLKDLDKYRAQNFLNEKIQEFETKKSETETV